MGCDAFLWMKTIWGLHWVWRVQTRLVERLYDDVVEEHQFDHQNRVTWDTWDAFAGVEKIIQETFLPRIFFGNTKTLFPVIGYLSTMSVNKYVMVLLNPLTSAQEKYLSSQRGIAELVRAVTGGGEFSNADHLQTLSEEQCDGEKSWDSAYESKLKGLVKDIKVTNKRLILCVKITGD